MSTMIDLIEGADLTDQTQFQIREYVLKILQRFYQREPCLKEKTQFREKRIEDVLKSHLSKLDKTKSTNPEKTEMMDSEIGWTNEVLKAPFSENVKNFAKIKPVMNSKGHKIPADHFKNNKQLQWTAFKEGSQEYNGWCQNDLREGCGTQTWKQGNKQSAYHGHWQENNFHGLGVYVKHDGQTYKGYWNNDTREGYGIQTWEEPSGSVKDTWRI